MTKKELFPPKKEASKNYKAINDVIEVFSIINPTISYGHKGHRTACERLFDKVGIDQTIRAAKYAISLSGTNFAPVITTPTALEHKLADLMIYHKKNNISNTVVV